MPTVGAKMPCVLASFASISDRHVNVLLVGFLASAKNFKGRVEGD